MYQTETAVKPLKMGTPQSLGATTGLGTYSTEGVKLF